MIKNLPAMQETQIRSLGQEILRRRKWQPTPVFLSRESRGQKSPRGHRESNTTERLTLSLSLYCWLHISVPKFKLIELYAKIKMINFTLSFSPNLLIYKSARKIPGCHIYPFLFILKYTVQWVLVYSPKNHHHNLFRTLSSPLRETSYLLVSLPILPTLSI